MAEIQNMLALKKNLNKKRPQFIRQEYRIRRKLRHEVKWRLPRGKHSKMREGRVGKVKRVQVGYRSPALVRGLTLTGIRPIVVHNLGELQKLNAKTDIAIFSSTIGLKARAEMFRKAQQMGIKTNVRQDRLDARLAEIKKKAQAKPEQKAEKPAQAQPAAGKKSESLLEKVGEPANTTQPKTELSQPKAKGKKVTGK
ncbi:MAG: hypothetical protein HY438_01135 [DPANN group archaeon]|nr:hypothetical protein [DPANN group archaeon]